MTAVVAVVECLCVCEELYSGSQLYVRARLAVGVACC